MFLFDKTRNSRQRYSAGNKIISVNWKIFLNTNPVFGAESTAVIDDKQNLYFGSHSGNFYSLDKCGKIRWVFTTKQKIYSSPALIDRSVFFAGGDGFVYSIDIHGNMNWTYDLSTSYIHNKYHRVISKIYHLPFTYSFARRRNITYRSWSSPNYIDKQIFITGYGKGLVSLDIEGNILWEYDLGFPRYQLSGVAIDDNQHIYGASRNGYAYCVSRNGNLVWQKMIKRFWEPWGNPVVCQTNETVYYFFSFHESKGVIAAISFAGKLKWQLTVGAIRGSCAVTKCGKYLYCCDLDGYIYKINSLSGVIELRKKITNCKRGLWITPTLDDNEDILLSTKESNTTGRVIKLNPEFDFIWEYHTNKVLSVPVINKNGDVFFGSWDGYYYSLKTKQ